MHKDIKKQIEPFSDFPRITYIQDLVPIVKLEPSELPVLHTDVDLNIAETMAAIVPGLSY